MIERSETNDQIAAIMLIHGSDHQRREALLYLAGELLDEKSESYVKERCDRTLFSSQIGFP